MEFFKEKYGDIKGKTDSMYVYVLFMCSQAKIKEHVKKQLDILERVNDAHKRKLFASRYFLIRDMIEQNQDDHVYDCVMFVGDDLNYHPLTHTQKELLQRFEHQNITFTYGSIFKLDFVEDLLFIENPYHIYRVNNNRIEYLQMTRTKKIVVDNKESKPLDIQGFIDQTLPPNTRYILYGTSSRLTDHNDPKAYGVINRHMKDEELICLTDRVDQENILSSFDDDLAMIRDPRQMHKVVFKKDIPGKIKNSQLAKLYIDTKLHDKFIENMKKSNLDMNFQIVQIDPSIKSFIDEREKQIDLYAGVVGICYY